MNVVLRFRGRDDRPGRRSDRRLILEHDGESRRRLSKVLCAEWNWVQPNGAPCDMVCRGLMLELHRAGWIELPPVRQIPPNNVALRRRRARVEVDATRIEASLEEVRPLECSRCGERARRSSIA